MTEFATDLATAGTPDAPASDVTPSEVVALLPSRTRAVNRIYAGSLLTLTGSIGFLGPWLYGTGLEIPGMLVALGGLGLAGVGLGIIGLAAKHLRRFGGAEGTLFLTAAGGLGASVLLWTIPTGLGVFGLVRNLQHSLLAAFGSMGTVLFTGMLVLLVVRALLRWATETDDPAEM